MTNWCNLKWHPARFQPKKVNVPIMAQRGAARYNNKLAGVGYSGNKHTLEQARNVRIAQLKC